MQHTRIYSEGKFAPLVLPTLREHGLLIALVGIYAAIALGLSEIYAPKLDTQVGLTLFWKFLGQVPGMIYLVLMWRFLHMRYVVRPADQMAWFKADIRQAISDPQRIVTAGVGLTLAIAIMASFAQLKKIIPILNPFSWDPSLADLDRFLHFGMDPGVALHAVFGHPWVVTLFTGAYNYWMFLLYFSLIFTCFSLAKPRERIRYFIAFMFCWGFGGNLVATLFSSVGPVYYERFGFGDDFVPLMQLLAEHARTQPISVLESQDALWWYYSGPVGLNGISAFPSMHVASTVLMTLYAYQYSRLLGRIMTGFSVVIMIGSVLLAWHYAVDGYAGAAIAIASWWAAGALMRRFPRWVPQEQR